MRCTAAASPLQHAEWMESSEAMAAMCGPLQRKEQWGGGEEAAVAAIRRRKRWCGSCALSAPPCHDLHAPGAAKAAKAGKLTI